MLHEQGEQLLQLAQLAGAVLKVTGATETFINGFYKTFDADKYIKVRYHAGGCNRCVVHPTQTTIYPLYIRIRSTPNCIA